MSNAASSSNPPLESSSNSELADPACKDDRAHDNPADQKLINTDSTVSDLIIEKSSSESSLSEPADDEKGATPATSPVVHSGYPLASSPSSAPAKTLTHPKFDASGLRKKSSRCKDGTVAAGLPLTFHPNSLPAPSEKTPSRSAPRLG